MSDVQRFWCHEASNIFCVRASDFDRVAAENAALQQRLNAADQRIDELTPKAGWKLVPIQPTAEMLSAIGADANDPALAQAHAAQHWAAMIEAVPNQPDQLRDAVKMIAERNPSPDFSLIGIVHTPPMEYDEP